MKLVELVSKLVALQVKHGNIEVLIQGDTIGWTEKVELTIDIDCDQTVLLLEDSETT